MPSIEAFSLSNSQSELLADKKIICRRIFLTRLTAALDWKKNSDRTHAAFKTLYGDSRGNTIYQKFLRNPDTMIDPDMTNYKKFQPQGADRRNKYPIYQQCFFDAIIAECHATLFDDATIYRVYGTDHLTDAPEQSQLDCTAFGETFTQLGSDYIDRFFIEYDYANTQLASSISQHPQSPLANIGRVILDKITTAKQQNLISFRDMPTVTSYMQSTANVIETQTEATINAYNNDVKHMMGINAQWAKGIASAMVTLLGLATVAASVAFGVMTGGAGTPLSIAGWTLGTNMLATGAALGGTGLLGAGLSYFAGRAAIQAKNGELATLGEELLATAKRAAH